MKFTTAIAALLAAVAVAAPSSNLVPRTMKDDSAPHQDDPDFISAVMRAHWYWRRWHCAQDLVWDSSLADAARADVAQCDQDMKHYRAGSNLSARGPAPSSRDDWLGFARNGSHGWHDEEPKYNYQQPGYSESTGHFTQMVWRETTRLGCAMADCPDTTNFPGRLYCYYENAGNIINAGEFEAQVWPMVCGDPSNTSEHKKREDPNYPWPRI